MSPRRSTANHACTGFLDRRRSSPARLRKEIAHCARSAVVSALLDASATAAAVLDSNRQIVALNADYLGLLGLADPRAALGLRPGEAIECAHSHEGPGGCGTGPACPSCGAAIAMLVAGHRGRVAERDCALRIDRGSDAVDRDLRARAAPLAVDREAFLLLTLRDVSAERRRDALARAFLHDVANLAAALRGASDALSGPAADPEAESDVRQIADRLVREVQLRRALLADRLPPSLAVSEPVAVANALERLRAAIARHPASAGKRVAIEGAGADATVATDGTLLHHVLAQMVLNALEATAPGGEVRVSARGADGALAFQVWNAGAIPAVVVPRIFQRYFSTRREPGRGQGTWAIKAIGEEQLGGAVSFSTSHADGTWFELRLPVQRPLSPAARGRGAP